MRKKRGQFLEILLEFGNWNGFDGSDSVFSSYVWRISRDFRVRVGYCVSIAPVKSVLR